MVGLAEEAGLTIAPEDLTLVHLIHRLSDGERMSMFFRATRWQGEPVNREPHKCSELRWLARDALPEPMVPYVRHALAQIAGGNAYSEFGWPVAAATHSA